MAVKVGDDVSYRITSRDESGPGVDNANRNLSRFESHSKDVSNRMKSHFEAMKANWLKITAAITGGILAIRKAWDMMDVAAGYEEQKAALASLTAQYNISAGDMITRVKEAARGLVSLKDAADMSAKAINQGLNPDQIIRFTRATELLTDVMQTDLPQAFQMLVTAAATGRMQTLAQVGIIMNLDDVYKKYAASIGKTKDSLTELDKQTIRTNAILEALEKKTSILGEAVDTTKDKMDRLKITIQDLQLFMGTMLIRTLAGVAGAFQVTAAFALALAGAIFDIIRAYSILAGKEKSVIEDLKISADAAFAGARELWEKGIENIGAMIAETEELISAKKRIDLASEIEKAGNAAQETGKKIKEVTKAGSEWKIETVKIEAEKRNEELNRMITEAKRLEQDLTLALLPESQRRIAIIQYEYEARIAQLDLLIEKGAIFAQGYDELKRKANEVREAELGRLDIETKLQELQRKGMALQAEKYSQLWGLIDRTKVYTLGPEGEALSAVMGGLEAMGKMALGIDPYFMELERLRNFWEQKKLLQQEGQASIEDVTAAHQAYLLWLDQSSNMQRIQSAQTMLGILGGIVNTIYAQSGQRSKALFFLSRAISTATAIINSFEAYTKALATIPPPANIPFAKMILAMGLAGAAAIAATSFTAGGGAAAAGAGATMVPTYAPIEPERAEVETQRPMEVNIHIYGNVVDHDKFARELIPSIEKALEDGVH